MFSVITSRVEIHFWMWAKHIPESDPLAG